MTSLLEILTNENDVVAYIKRCERNIELFEEDIKRVERIDIECEAKSRDIARWKDLIEEERWRIVIAERKLDDIRAELRDYLKELMN